VKRFNEPDFINAISLQALPIQNQSALWGKSSGSSRRMEGFHTCFSFTDPMINNEVQLECCTKANLGEQTPNLAAQTTVLVFDVELDTQYYKQTGKITYHFNLNGVKLG